jgi:hypothetical protein
MLIVHLLLALPLVQQDPRSHTRTHNTSSECFTLLISTLLLIALLLSFFILISRYLNVGVNRPTFLGPSRHQDLRLPFSQLELHHVHPWERMLIYVYCWFLSWLKLNSSLLNGLLNVKAEDFALIGTMVSSFVELTVLLPF